MSRLTSIWLTVAVLAAGALCSGSAHAQSSPFTGRWRWNKSQSTLPPGEPPPADLVMEINRADAAHVQWTITAKDQQGQSDVESFDAPANGKPYPIGNDASASMRLGPGTLQATFTGPGPGSDVLNCRLSPDGRRMTCNGQLTTSDGNTTRYIDVFDRS